MTELAEWFAVAVVSAATAVAICGVGYAWLKGLAHCHHRQEG